MDGLDKGCYSVLGTRPQNRLGKPSRDVASDILIRQVPARLSERQGSTSEPFKPQQDQLPPESITNKFATGPTGLLAEPVRTPRLAEEPAEDRAGFGAGRQKLGHHLASVSDLYLVPRPHLPHVPAEVILQLSEADLSHIAAHQPGRALRAVGCMRLFGGLPATVSALLRRQPPRWRKNRPVAMSCPALQFAGVAAEDEHRQPAFRGDEVESPPECAGGLSRSSYP